MYKYIETLPPLLNIYSINSPFFIYIKYQIPFFFFLNGNNDKSNDIIFLFLTLNRNFFSDKILISARFKNYTN